MDAIRMIVRPLSRPLGRLLLTVALTALPIATSHAAPIRRFPPARLAAQEIHSGAGTATGNGWASFLAGGEPTWASRLSPAFTMPVRRAVLQLINGDPAIAASSPLISYLVWRRNLDMARFDYYHPYIGPRLPQGLTPPVPIVVPPLTPPTDVPTDPVDPPLTPPVTIVVPPVVPEPSALLVIATGIIGAVWMRRRPGVHRPA